MADPQLGHFQLGVGQLGGARAPEAGTSPPTVTKPPNQTTEIGVFAELQIEATNTTEYAASGLPTGLSINAGTGKISGTPTTLGAAKEVTVTVKGPGGEASTKFTWAIVLPATERLLMLLRERPPLRLDVLSRSPDGRVTARWGFDDKNPIYAPKDMSFGTAMPGGFDRFTCTMERNPRRRYPDTAPLSTLTVLGCGGAVAWQGRIEKVPDTGGFQSQETPEAVGWQAHLEDDKEAREIYIDQELAKWEGMHTQRKINMIGAGYLGLNDPTSEPGEPGVFTSLTLPVGPKGLSEAWYDAKGIPIGKFQIGYKITAGPGPTDPEYAVNWVLTGTDVDEGGHDVGTKSPLESSYVEPEPLAATSATRVFAYMNFVYYGKGLEPATGGTIGVIWNKLVVQGRHNLPKRGEGLYGWEIVPHAIAAFAPKIAIGSVILPSTPFVVPQAAFLTPTTVAEMIKQVMRFELPDWAVWEGPAFYMAPHGEMPTAKKWRARIGPAQLQETGPQVSRVYNGVVVQYTDPVGVTRMVGPTGFAGGGKITEAGGTPASTEDALLADKSPENPLNDEYGNPIVKKWALLTMGTSTLEGAKKVGRVFLAESKTLDRSGQASLVGHVEDQNGTWWPAWMVRAGDEVAFLDAAEPGYRRIVNTSYSDSTKTNQIQLEQPPEGLQALLERLSVALAPLGLS